MSTQFELRTPATTFDHETTVVAAMELSGKSWIISGAIPGVDRRPKKTFAVGDIASVADVLKGWRKEAAQAGKLVSRTIVGYEAGYDGYSICTRSHQRVAWRRHGSAYCTDARFEVGVRS